MQLELFGNDKKQAEYYALIAQTEEVWVKYAELEILELLKKIDLPKGAKVLDVGCGIGRHALQLALKGYDVFGFDFTKECIKKAEIRKGNSKDGIAAAGGKLFYEVLDARDIPPRESADLVLCLYDVIGSSERPADAVSIINSLFRVTKPGGFVAVGCLNGIKNFRNGCKYIQDEPVKEVLLPIDSVGNPKELFDFAKMAYNINNGVLYRHEYYSNDKNIQFDELVKERRYLPVEIIEILKNAGFVEVKAYSVKAGKWQLDDLFDVELPELLFICKRPKELLASIPKLDSYKLGKNKNTYAITIIHKEDIKYHHAYIVSRIFSTSFGKNPKTGKHTILGPNRMWKRLQKCSYLCFVVKGNVPVGFLFGTEYIKNKTIAWLDSMCVVAEFRRKGYARAMLDSFAHAIPDFEYFGCTTPNPITPLIFEKLKLGKRMYLAGNPAPDDVKTAVEFISLECEDLKGYEIDWERMLVTNKFAIDIEGNWDSNATNQPAWWGELANLPEDKESLVIIHRDSTAIFD